MTLNSYNMETGDYIVYTLLATLCGILFFLCFRISIEAKQRLRENKVKKENLQRLINEVRNLRIRMEKFRDRKSLENKE